MDMTPNERQFDRRKHARVVKDLFTVYATSDPFQEGLFKTENISGAGILFRLRTPIKIGATMNLNIHLPYQVNPIPCEGRVVRTVCTEGRPSSFDVGVAFTKMADPDKKQLVRSLLTQDDFYLFLQ